MTSARSDSQRSTPVRYGPTLLLGLVGGVAVMVGVAKPWATATAQQAGLPELHADVTGADLAPLAGALGVVVLAAFGAVIATRGRARQTIGVLVVLASLVVLVSAIHPPAATDALRDALAAKGWSGGDVDTSTAAWRWVALAGSLAAIAAGLAISLYGARWATMGAAYDAPAPTAGPSQTGVGGLSEGTSDAEVWREIDRGRDPTHTEGT